MRRIRSPLSVALVTATCGLLLACAAWAATQQAQGVSWAETGKKIVPILSVGSPGVHLGVAQVVGPKVQVAKVKGVAQLELEFKRAFRIRVYIPVSSIRTDKLQRVQGCSVWATGELGLVKF